MEGDEIEITREELQRWIAEHVKDRDLVSPDLLKKYHQLQTLLEKREKQAANLLKLFESVAKCEAIVKKQYSLLGWEYRDADSEDDDNITDTGNAPESPRENLNAHPSKKHTRCLKQPVVVLMRLPEHKIRALCGPTPVSHHSEDELPSSSDSDGLWEPKDEDSSDTDVSATSCETGGMKRRKNSPINETVAKTDAAKTSTRVTNTSTPQASSNTSAMKDVRKTPAVPAGTNSTAATPARKVSAPSKVPPALPEVTVGTSVLARKTAMKWKKGIILEIITKENGSVKYKVGFEGGYGRKLVSGHHIAFDLMPKLDNLPDLSRVVIRNPSDESLFCPGILAEGPGRRNRMRFLVFMDDHRPVYVGLPAIRLVCKPLPNPWDDISDEMHRNFIEEYKKFLPNPPQTQYIVGQKTNAEFNGVQQLCNVMKVDCSLIEVVFEEDQHKEWMYRGCPRLEHMVNMRKNMLRNKVKKT